MKRDKHIILIQMTAALGLMAAPMPAYAQSQGYTYISEKTYTNASGTASNETISYYDGLGRPSENVRKNAWISGNSVSGSIVSTFTYDACGRPSRTLLPTGISNNGAAYVSPANALTAAVSLYGDGAPYTEVQYDAHPLDRVRSEWGAGTQWRQSGKKTGHVYVTNSQSNASRNAKKFTAEYSGDAEVIIKKNGNHANGTIRIEEVTDEDGRCTCVFTDAFGRTILRRQLLTSSSFADTYYCYDAAGRLAAVLPPELSASLVASSSTTFTTSSSNPLKRYGYFYRYDAKGQLIAKKLPGAEWTYYIYDKGGRLVYSQDGNQRERGEWSFVLADLQGRECIRGTMQKTMSPFGDPLGNVNVFAQRNEPATDMTDYGYLSVNCSLHGADVLSVTWYDDYSFLGNMDGIPSAASSTSPTRYANPAASDGLGDKYTYSGAGQITGKWEKVLGETEDNLYLWTVLYYDIRGRVTQESHSTHRGGWQRTNTGYDFIGHPLKARTDSHDTGAGDMTELYTYGYDAWGRPKTVTHKLDALSAVTLHDYAYDGAGRVISDARNGDADLTERYGYNVRSWKTDIKVGGNAQQGTLGETFTEKLYFHTQRPSNPQATVQWGGNVSAMDWMAGSDGVTRRYDFGYDGMSRLTGAAYADDNGGAGLYNRSYSYDRNSNITAVTSPSGTVQMSYVGNHLNGTNYDYDANGNLTKDLGRSIASIDYNQLNLPSSVAVNNGSLDGELLLYSASGVKLEAKDLYPFVLPGHTDNRPRTDYVGNLIYDKTSLKKVLVPGGYVEVSGTSRLYRFFVSDHLGGNRLVTDASGAILQTNHYDPYGQSLPAGAAVDSGNPYKFSGKEYDTQASSYDFGARYYTLSNPRWTTMDPLCEKYYSISPYAYCAGNPVNMVDPDGKKIRIWYKQDGERRCFEYSGEEDDSLIPDNDYVRAVIQVYQYNKTNWRAAGFSGDSPSTILVESKDYNVNVYFDSEFEMVYFRSNGGFPNINWDPYGGLLTDEKVTLSPATVFAHESDHAIDDMNDAVKHSNRQSTTNVRYDNDEEQRVIVGTEQKTAIANGEISRGGKTRRNHKGTTVYTISPVSSVIDYYATMYYRKHIKK